jgi:hypothetical protein
MPLFQNPLFVACCPEKHLHQVTGQEEVGDALLDGVLVPTVSAHKLALRHLCLKEQVMQILERLLIRLELLGRGGLLRELRETKL